MHPTPSKPIVVSMTDAQFEPSLNTGMSDSTADKASEKPARDKAGGRWTGAAAMAGAAIGSAALAAALLYVNSRRGSGKAAPSHPEDAPETD